MLNIITKIFGTKSERDLRELTPYVGKVNDEYKTLQAVSDDELRGKTTEVKLHIQQKLQNIDDQLSGLHKRIPGEP
jgi:preprotein translocase subunit SecA